MSLAWVSLSACHPDEMTIRGNLEGFGGSVVITSLDPSTLDTVELARLDSAGGSWKLKLKGLIPPGRIWLHIGADTVKEVIVDSRRKLWVEGGLADSSALTVSGSEMSLEYDYIREQLRSNYDKPIAELEGMIRNLEHRDVLSSRGIYTLKSYRWRLEKFKKYRREYVEKLVALNPDRELSLFLIWDEMRDSVNSQRTAFETMEMGNRKSHIFRLIERKLAKDTLSDAGKS